MDRFVKKHITAVKTTALILMLIIPFLLYAAALHNSVFQVKILLVTFIINMLCVIKYG